MYVFATILRSHAYIFFARYSFVFEICCPFYLFIFICVTGLPFGMTEMNIKSNTKIFVEFNHFAMKFTSFDTSRALNLCVCLQKLRSDESQYTHHK